MRTDLMCSAALALLLLLAGATAAAQQHGALTVWNRLTAQPGNVVLLIQLLDSTAPRYGTATLRISEPLEQGRAIRELSRGRLDLILAMSSRERGQTLRAVPMPVDHGILGLRVCLIRAGEQARFDGIDSLAAWRASGLTIGQGAHWPDTELLRDNGIEVVTSARYLPLFDMLKRKRFDCFSRSVTEVFQELALRGDDELEIEKGLLLYYPASNFFFVNRDNETLFRRLADGLADAAESGYLERHWRYYFGDTLSRLRLSQRRLIVLENRTDGVATRAAAAAAARRRLPQLFDGR